MFCMCRQAKDWWIEGRGAASAVVVVVGSVAVGGARKESTADVRRFDNLGAGQARADAKPVRSRQKQRRKVQMLPKKKKIVVHESCSSDIYLVFRLL